MFGFVVLCCLVIDRRSMYWVVGERGAHHYTNMNPPDNIRQHRTAKPKLMSFIIFLYAFDLIFGSKFKENIQIYKYFEIKMGHPHFQPSINKYFWECVWHSAVSVIFTWHVTLLNLPHILLLHTHCHPWRTVIHGVRGNCQ